jgi:CheY-like chemotaxis protein
MSGEDVLHALHDDPATAQLPVAIVSADAMPRQVQRLLAVGASANLTKPIDVRQLLALLDTALETFSKREDAVASAAPDAGGS